jgi:hypothetical protein
MVFYRIVINERDGSSNYSPVVRVYGQKGGTKLNVQAEADNIRLHLQEFTKGQYQLHLVNTAGASIAKQTVNIYASGNSVVSVKLTNELAHGIYYAVVRNERGDIIAKANFFY